MPPPRPFFIFSLAVALLAYLWGAGSVQIPKIGDEVLYLQIARVTGESGDWLPLRYEQGVLSTKPPLLYWLGISSAKIFGPTLWAYRLPVLLATALSAFLVFLFGLRYLKDRRASLWAALVYLAFISTYQHGRPFLVNSFEVLFLFWPCYQFFRDPRLNLRNWVICALSWGLVAWTKSFALIGVGAFSLWWAAPHIVPSRDRPWFRRALYFGSAGLLSLGIFALWFVFDPDPRLLFQQFIIGENAVKFKGYAHYLSGLFSGNYPLFRIWLGPFANAGLVAIPLIGLFVGLGQRRKTLPADDRYLATYVLAFLVFYSLPTQRQENYLLPVMAALALLLAKYRDKIAAGFWSVSTVLTDIAFGLLSLAPFLAGLWEDFSIVAKILWALALLAYLFARKFWGRWAFPALALLTFVQLTNFSEPVNRQFRFFEQSEAKDVWVPNRKLAQEERFRFMAPGSVPHAYSPGESFGEACGARHTGELMILEEGDLAKCARKFENLEEILDFKTRQKFDELLKIATGRKEYLLRKLILIRITE